MALRPFSLIFYMTKTRLLILLLVQALCFPALSGNISKRYKTYRSELGTLYFIMPQKMAKAKGCTAQKDLLFDVTCQLWTDSVTVAATVKSSLPVTDSIVKISLPDNNILTYPLEFIYRDLDKKGYDNRIKFRMPRQQFRQMFNGSTPFLLDFGKGNLFSFRQSQWAKEQDQMNSILEMMELNK